MIDIIEEREKARRVVETDNFDYLIMFVICMDAVALGLLSIGFQSFEFVRIMFLLDKLCVAIYIVEILIKMYAYGPKFFKSGWNIFDTTVVGISVIPATGFLMILRTFRLFRLLRYVNRFRPMKNIINIMLAILPNLMAMMIVLTVFIYVFAIMAVELFGDNINAFENLGAAVFSLLQAFTMDGWASTIARPVMRIYPQSWIFFVAYVGVSFWLLISFVLSVITMMVKKEFKIQSKL